MHIQVIHSADGTQNGMHGSDSEQSAAREIQFFFPNHVSAFAPSTLSSKALTGQFEETLCKALTILARDKPSNDPTETLTWLANWLLEHNPNKPRIVGADNLSLDDVDDEADFKDAIEAERQHQKGVNEAATTVQSAYRGHRDRKRVRHQGSNGPLLVCLFSTVSGLDVKKVVSEFDVE
jgi:hypothetical protein